MTRTTILARCSAAAATATLLAGLAATSAAARSDPGEPAPQQVQLDGGVTKAQIEHHESLFMDGRTKAQIEHDEQLPVSPSGSNDATASSDEFPWAVASLAAAGFAVAATSGVVARRQRRTALQGT